MAGQKEARLAAVSEATNQAREIWGRWSWVEPAAWTERMLTALEDGVKGSKWFALIDKVYSPANLLAAFEKVKANRGSAGVDRESIGPMLTLQSKGCFPWD